jgi:L,D-peptidoglycan transpeptidase YkuD (ErfK/YbiS/YcfS/YnhG family)
VESYIEIKVVFADGRTIIDRTWCDEGKDPNWNEVKTFPFKPISTEYFTKKQLYDDNSMITISLFDR